MRMSNYNKDSNLYGGNVSSEWKIVTKTMFMTFFVLLLFRSALAYHRPTGVNAEGILTFAYNSERMLKQRKILCKQ